MNVLFALRQKRRGALKKTPTTEEEEYAREFKEEICMIENVCIVNIIHHDFLSYVHANIRHNKVLFSYFPILYLSKSFLLLF